MSVSHDRAGRFGHCGCSFRERSERSRIEGDGERISRNLDTSGFVPLLVSEPSSEACRRFWDDTDAVASSRLLYVETAAVATFDTNAPDGLR